MKVVERAVLGFMCKQIIDMGRLMWVKECGFETQLVRYVPSSISPENHLLIARHATKF
jgi:tRNA:m4X modification enzyme